METKDEQVIVLEQDNDEIQEPESLKSEVEPEAVKQETQTNKQNFKNSEIPF